MKKSFILLAALAVFAACNEAVSPTPSQDTDIVTAVIEQETVTKTYMDAQNNIRWSEGDQIIGFMKTSLGLKYRILSSSVGKTSASFENVSESDGNVNVGIEWNHKVFFYPYSETIEAAKSGDHYALDIVLPSEQTYVAESFGNGAMAMVAVSENNNITFKNVLGGIKLQLKGTQKVTSIKLEGKNGEKLSGAATVKAYTDENKPAITMASGASTSVTLNCGTGVQLNESKATEFIISLPPVLFSKGFTVMVTDSEGQTCLIGSDKANTILRASLLVMPVVNLEKTNEENPDEGEETYIPVMQVLLNYSTIKLYTSDVIQLSATVMPRDATDKEIVWSSDAPSIASVDQSGYVTAYSEGKVNISATAGGKTSSCFVEIYPSTDYIDEYGINHGKGIVIGSAIWAPVNCGYHKDDFKYGKLYQWGRKYGQGYNGTSWADNSAGEHYSDGIIPTYEEGGVSSTTGNNKGNANVFYYGTEASGYNWIYPQNNKLWNSGTEYNPIKGEYDPCPEGWRVPTFDELEELISNYKSGKNELGQPGYWLSGVIEYSNDAPQIFIPNAGCNYESSGKGSDRGLNGYYWTSQAGYMLGYGMTYAVAGLNIWKNSKSARGCSVRCVKETD